MELANELGSSRDVVCPAMADDDPSVFAMRVVPVEGKCQKALLCFSVFVSNTPIGSLGFHKL